MASPRSAERAGRQRPGERERGVLPGQREAEGKRVAMPSGVSPFTLVLGGKQGSFTRTEERCAGLQVALRAPPPPKKKKEPSPHSHRGRHVQWLAVDFSRWGSGGGGDHDSPPSSARTTPPPPFAGI